MRLLFKQKVFSQVKYSYRRWYPCQGREKHLFKKRWSLGRTISKREGQRQTQIRLCFWKNIWRSWTDAYCCKSRGTSTKVFVEFLIWERFFGVVRRTEAPVKNIKLCQICKSSEFLSASIVWDHADSVDYAEHCNEIQPGVAGIRRSIRTGIGSKNGKQYRICLKNVLEYASRELGISTTSIGDIFVRQPQKPMCFYRYISLCIRFVQMKLFRFLS